MSNKRVLALTLIAIVILLLAAPVRRGSARTPLSVSMYCLYTSYQLLDCEASPSGGTGTYTYQWTPTPSWGGNETALISCQYNRNKTVSVIVTDSDGATASATAVAFCGGPPAE